MKRNFLLHVFFLIAYFSNAQNKIIAETSLKYLDNYSNLQTYWLNDAVSNSDAGSYFKLTGRTGYPMGESANRAPAFSSITTLNPIPIGGIDTQHKPQAKTWFYANRWWCAVPPSSGGTWIFRLDGTTWTPVLRLATSGSRTDCWVVGDLVHILMFRGSGANAIATAQYDPGTNTYKTWNQRPTVTNVSFPTGVENATLTIDGTGRMWVAADAVNDIRVWWSDSPYTTWSAAITVATGISSDDIGAITKLQGKIGVFWSNQNTGLFGFKIHIDGDSPANWSADEVPASQSAIPGNPRMADDHMNLTLAGDGTLYCVAKTSYNNISLPELILLVRRPAGTWDNLYPVTIGGGSQAIVLLNEVVGKVKVVYTSVSNGGQILYKESPVSNISFSSAATLMGGPTANYNFSSSTHQTYNPDVAIIATDQGTPRQIVSVLASDEPSGDITPPSVVSILRSSPSQQNTTATTVVFAVNFSESVTGVNATDFTLTTGGTANGNISTVNGSGAAYTVTVNNITGTGSLRLDLNGSGTGIVDGASNAITGGFTSGETYNVSPGDVTPPSVISILRSSPTQQNTTATTVVFAVNFSESVTGVNAPDFTLTTGGTANGNISTVNGSGATYTVTVNNITGTGSLRLDLNGSGTGIVDGASNPITGGFTSGETYNVSPGDVTPPSVESILRSSPTQQNTTATTVVFAVNFSESVTGVNAPDFTLTTGGTANGNISNVNGSGAAYTVTVNNITGTGSLRLDLNSSGTGIVDGASNPITGGFTSGETYNVSPGDVTPPSVESILRSSPTQQNTTATTVVFAVNFSESVTGVNAADFTLTTGGTANGSITNVNGSGAAYTVTVSGITGTGSLRLDLDASGTGIVDGSGNPITGGFTNGESYNVSPGDVTPPSVVSIVRSSPAEQNTTATTLVFGVNFSEAVNGVDATDFILTKTGSADGSISLLLGVCANYTVTVTSVTGTGTLRLDLKNTGTGIVDAVGNAIAGGFTSGETYILESGQRVAPDGPKDGKNPPASSIQARVYPNPFSSDAIMSFTLAQTGMYIIRLYDNKGIQLAQVDEGTANASVTKHVKIDGSGLAAGMYLVSIQTRNEVKVLKLVKNNGNGTIAPR